MKSYYILPYVDKSKNDLHINVDYYKKVGTIGPVSLISFTNSLWSQLVMRRTKREELVTQVNIHTYFPDFTEPRDIAEHG